MSLDRQEVYESRQRPRSDSSAQPAERNREAEIQYVVETAKMTIDQFVKKGFSMDAAIMLCGQILPKLL